MSDTNRLVLMHFVTNEGQRVCRVREADLRTATFAGGVTFDQDDLADAEAVRCATCVERVLARPGMRRPPR